MSTPIASEISFSTTTSIPPHYFLCNEDNRELASGRSRVVPSRNRYIIILLMILLVPGFIFSLIGVPSFLNTRDLSQNGVTTTALIISHNSLFYSDSKGRPQTNYYVTYTYNVQDANNKSVSYAHQQAVTQQFYQNAVNFTDTTVTYAPDNPSNVALVGDEQDNTINILVIIFAVACLIGAIMCGIGFRRRQAYDQRLSTDGKIITGQISHSEEKVTRTKNQTVNEFIISYHFLGPDAQGFVNKTISIDSRNVVSHSLPKVGTLVAILYLNAKHFEML